MRVELDSVLPGANRDNEFLGVRTSWMLSQPHGAPFDHVLQVNNGRIVKIASDKRPLTTDSNRHGFYEPGTVVNLAAP